MGYSEIKEKLNSGIPVILDGGTGSEVIRRGVRWRKHGLDDASDVIRQIHMDYIDAGADIIRSHTFNLTKRSFVNFFRNRTHMLDIGAPGLETRANDLCRRAVSLAREAVAQSEKEGLVAIAGSISPVNHPFRPDLSPPEGESLSHHRECIKVLADTGVDFLFLECLNTLTELRAAVQAAAESSLPFWVSVIPDLHGNLLSGESLSEAASSARKGGAEVVLLSAAPPHAISKALPTIIGGKPAGAEAIMGKYSPPSWKPDFYPRFVYAEASSEGEYGEYARNWVGAGAAVVGGSNGTMPTHISEVKRALR